MLESGTPGEPEGYEFVMSMDGRRSEPFAVVLNAQQKARKCVEELAWYSAGPEVVNRTPSLDQAFREWNESKVGMCEVEDGCS